MEEVSRILGDFRSKDSAGGPTLIVMTAIHGNEPAGPHAAARVLRKLNKGGIEFQGRVVVLVGNMPAYLQNVRYIDEDFNRMWTQDPESFPESDLNNEQQEYKELREVFVQVAEEAKQEGEVYLVDLHTSSGHAVPFGGASLHKNCIDFSKKFPIPFYIGLEEGLEGLFYVFAADMGIPSVVVEGGQHEAPSSVDNHEAAIWTALIAAECVSVDKNPELGEYYRLLRVQRGNAPKNFEIFYCHEITEEDQFKMLPNFTTFQHVRKGEVLAHDKNGEIVAPEDCMILLPLYQPYGNDGFFLIREAAPPEEKAA